MGASDSPTEGTPAARKAPEKQPASSNGMQITIPVSDKQLSASTPDLELSPATSPTHSAVSFSDANLSAQADNLPCAELSLTPPEWSMIMVTYLPSTHMESFIVNAKSSPPNLEIRATSSVDIAHILSSDERLQSRMTFISHACKERHTSKLTTMKVSRIFNQSLPLKFSWSFVFPKRSTTTSHQASQPSQLA
ncbi:hypothetical protein V2G26_003724 [Clonostachys chloroleuca]